MNPLQLPVQPADWRSVLVLLIAAGMIGCEQHATSQSPGIVPSAQTAVVPEPAATTNDAPPAVEPVAAKPVASADVQEASHAPPAYERPRPLPTPDTAPPGNDEPPKRAALRPKADRSTTADGVEKITFDDLILGMQADMVYRPWMLESESNGGRAKELEGKRVRLAGIMHAGVQSQTKNKDFVLLRNKECKFGPGGQADHLAKIFMKEGKTAAFAGDDTVFVEGTLRIKPETGEDGNTWSIYEIEGAELK